jgi:hypothetical protein
MTAPVRQSVPQLTGAELERRKRDEKDMNRTRANWRRGTPYQGTFAATVESNLGLLTNALPKSGRPPWATFCFGSHHLARGGASD